MNYTTIGYIENATDLKNQFINTLGRPSVVFSREGGKNDVWIFAVISDKPIETAQPIPIILTYNVPGTEKTIFWNLDLPIEASQSPISYRFTIDDSGAHIVPRK
jgi:hypothetical protein